MTGGPALCRQSTSNPARLFRNQKLPWGWLGFALLKVYGATRVLRHEPRLSCEGYAVLCEAAAEGPGVAFLPDHACVAHPASGRLVRVFPEWRRKDGIVHLVFTTRRGLPPSSRALIDQMAREFPEP